MEVHAHTHPSTSLPAGQAGSGPRKKWTHYFWEFLMLFLAVTLGFLVENQREHYVENQRAKVYAKLLIDDMNFDIAELNRAYRILTKIIIAGDSLAYLLDEIDNKKVPGGKLYFFEYWSGWRWRVISRDATIEQLKNSGSLRYMTNTIVRKILNYEEALKIIYMLQDKYEPDKIQNWNLVQKVFDYKYFDQLDKIKSATRDSSGKSFDEKNHELDVFLNKDIPLNTYDKDVLFELKNWASNSSSSYKVQVGNFITAKQKAEIAIEALKSEYNLK